MGRKEVAQVASQRMYSDRSRGTMVGRKGLPFSRFAGDYGEKKGMEAIKPPQRVRGGLW